MNQFTWSWYKPYMITGEYYWMIDSRPIVRYLNEAVSAGACPRLEVFGSPWKDCCPHGQVSWCGRLRTVLSGRWWIRWGT